MKGRAMDNTLTTDACKLTTVKAEPRIDSRLLEVEQQAIDAAAQGGIQ